MQTYEQFAAHIEAETDKARQAAPVEVMALLDKTSVGCVDGLTKKGEWNPPGGLVFLYNETDREGMRLLELYVAQRHGKGGELAAHLRCGYMAVVMGKLTAAEHKQLILQAMVEVKRLNEKYGANFKTVIEFQGSAAAYMTG